MEGHLAILDDALENAWVATTFQPFAAKAWIGLHDALVEGELRSVDGRPVEYTRLAANGAGNSDTSDFLEIDFATGTWTFQSSIVARRALVEVAPTPEVLAGPIRNNATSADYYLLTDTTWKKAQAKARELGGNLASISSAEENAWILSQFGRWDEAQPIWLWIGLSDEEVEGEFRWASGEALTFTNWGNDQPDNFGNQEDFVHTWPDGRWNDLTNIPGSDIGGLWLGVVEVPSTRLNIRVSEVELIWRAALGRRYQLQRSTSVGDPGWLDVGEARVGTGSDIIVKVPIEPGSTTSLFRLLEVF